MADTTDAIYVFEKGHLPVYYFPAGDVRFDLLEPTTTSTHCPRKGDASYWTIVVGERRVDAVWGYPNPIDGMEKLADYVAFYWDRVDAWFEEDDEVFKHARDPYKRIDVLQSSRHVEVFIDGVKVADTVRPRLLFETGLPTRYYLPKLDVRSTSSGRHTTARTRAPLVDAIVCTRHRTPRSGRERRHVDRGDAS